MTQKEFTIKMLELGAELDQATSKIQISMIVNDAEKLTAKFFAKGVTEGRRREKYKSSTLNC